MKRKLDLLCGIFGMLTLVVGCSSGPAANQNIANGKSYLGTPGQPSKPDEPDDAPTAKLTGGVVPPHQVVNAPNLPVRRGTVRVIFVPGTPKRATKWGFSAGNKPFNVDGPAFQTNSGNATLHFQAMVAGDTAPSPEPVTIGSQKHLTVKIRYQ